MIKLTDISIGHQRTLCEIKDLVLERGEMVVLIGPNGSGKTTFFNTLLGIQSPIKGTVMVGDRPLSSIAKQERTQQVGFVPSRFNGVSHLTVRELISLGRSPYTNMLNRLGDRDKKVVDEVLKTLKIEELADQLTTQVSDGERQIAMIGKALAQETSSVLLDEPTAFLDYSNRKKVLQLLKDLSHQENKLILVSSHDIELCLEYADRIIAIEQEQQSLKTFTPPYEKEKIVKLIFDA